MGDFNRFWELLKDSEGNYSFVKGDKGGETFMGIARKSNPNWSGWAEIDKMKLDLKVDHLPHNTKIPSLETFVKDFYKTEYWDKAKGSDISDDAIATMIVDVKVNGGWGKDGTIIKKIQETVGCKQDGLWGKGTVDAINKHKDQKGLLQAIYDARKKHYENVIKKDPSQKKFHDGWINRIDKLKKEGLNGKSLQPEIDRMAQLIRQFMQNLKGGKGGTLPMEEGVPPVGMKF